MGKTTAELVREKINGSLYLKEPLKKGLINFSELTRQLLPEIRKENEKAKFESVLIALQRYYDEIKGGGTEDTFKEILSESELMMKNNIVTLAIERNKKTLNLLTNISKEIRWDLGSIMFFIQGLSEITVIIDKKNIKKFDKIKILEKKENMATISIREPDNLKKYSKDVLGFLALLTTTLSDNNINIYDMATTYKEITFVVEEKQLMSAYNTLKKLISN
jgi:aspartokinase